MGVVSLQILQWILGIVLFLLLLTIVFTNLVLFVPIRYRAEGEFIEKNVRFWGKITWFFHLVYITFFYEDNFRIQIRILGHNVFDSMDKESESKKKTTKKETVENDKINTEYQPKKNTEEKIGSRIDITDDESIEEETHEYRNDFQEDFLTAWEQEIEEQEKEEADISGRYTQRGTQKFFHKEKKSIFVKINDIKSKIRDSIKSAKDFIENIKNKKIKLDYYLEIWNRAETQIAFEKAKKKLWKMLKSVLPKEWNINGEVGFDNPAATGQFMGVLGAMYPLLGNKVHIVPNFDNQTVKIEGKLHGHIRSGNLLYQFMSLILNKHCFKFIKLVLSEVEKAKKEK